MISLGIPLSFSPFFGSIIRGSRIVWENDGSATAMLIVNARLEICQDFAWFFSVCLGDNATCALELLGLKGKIVGESGK